MTTRLLPNRLRLLMGDRNRSQFARDCEMSEATLRSYLNGTVPGTDMLVRIARACGASVEWLATGEGVPYPPRQITEITPLVAARLDMKEQYVKAAFYRLQQLQEEQGRVLHPDAVWFAISMLNQLMIDRFEGDDADEAEIDAVLADYIDRSFSR